MIRLVAVPDIPARTHLESSPTWLMTVFGLVLLGGMAGFATLVHWHLPRMRRYGWALPWRLVWLAVATIAVGTVGFLVAMDDRGDRQRAADDRWWVERDAARDRVERELSDLYGVQFLEPHQVWLPLADGGREPVDLQLPDGSIDACELVVVVDVYELRCGGDDSHGRLPLEPVDP
ncbi:hypothetical protein Q6348_02355 [Isoptericola sp. b441]|uniref:Uncharacterized protein n=1 Tax=Actinotalea lenta TaxID=3064654 RepID=A0ABT9D5G8_9CELL|nr:hypothetical protein [Isoptericola sp. b441]MDO8106034.1 hypothetical protein [Isoptericola sp. b441]